MRFDGNTPLYTAFAIVAIESVWPNPEGGELSVDSYDMELLASVGESGVGPNPGLARKNFAEGIASSEDFHKSKGYYKIIPLNVLSVNVNSSTGGHSFDIKFTLDDLVMVTDREDAITNATGLPINRADLASMDDLPAVFQVSDDFQVITDSDLGLNRYRISGPNTSFNIEDLVTPNDTVTIWLYHDPQEFYFKDDLQSEPTSDTGLSWIIGSGNRKGQYGTTEPTFRETILGVTGMITEYTEEAMQSVISGADPESMGDSIKGMTADNIASAVIALVEEGMSGVDPLGGGSELRLLEYSRALYGDYNGELIFNWVLRPLGNTGINYEGGSQGGILGEEVRGRRRNLFREFVASLSPGPRLSLFSTDLSAESISIANEMWAISDKSLLFDSQGYSMVHGLNLFAQEMNAMLGDYLSNDSNRAIVSKVTQDFSNGRTVIISGDGTKPMHGDTPYTVLKGQLSSISTSVGTTQGTHTVTISGKGMEKVITEHEVFFDAMVIGGGVDGDGARSDFNVLYSRMSPPLAALSILNRWAPKQVVIGPPTNWTVDIMQTVWTLGAESSTDDINEREEGEHEVEADEVRLDMPDDLIIRGNILAGRNSSSATDNYIRVFFPVNYIDTYRIREGVQVLAESYNTDQGTGVIATSQILQSGESVMSNIHRIIGVGQLYEFYIDETARARYRLTFEALERTPQPKYIPIVQDIDLLGDGATFSVSDAELKTAVYVVPYDSDGSAIQTEWGYVGASLPPASTPPLLELPSGVEESEMSTDLFRYGTKSQIIQDIYTMRPDEAIRKADLYRGFYGNPLKSAQIKVKGDPSYRAGETVLVSLQKSKYRSRVPIDLTKMIDWLNYLGNHPDLLEMYIGVDERLMHPEYYAKTANFQAIPADGYYYPEFMANPREFVRTSFLRTFEFMRDTLPGVNVITPDYFPSTYWYTKEGGLAHQGWDENSVSWTDVNELYSSLLRAAILGDSAALSNSRELYFNNPGIMNAIKFQDFRALSYYISGVTHSFVQDADMSTTLNLSHGQDNLILLEPSNFLPIGFLSIEKRMRIGYDDEVQHRYFEEGDTRSSLQNFFVNQFKADKKFKQSNFLYTSQFVRNTSNYMYQIGIMTDLDRIIDGGDNPSVPHSAGSGVEEGLTKEVFNDTGTVQQFFTDDYDGLFRAIDSYHALKRAQELLDDPDSGLVTVDDLMGSLRTEFPEMTDAELTEVINAVREDY